MRKIFLLAGVMIALLVEGIAFAGGQVRWQKDGVVIAWGTADPGWQGVTIVPDGRGGAIIGWADTRGHPNESIFAQRVDSSGTSLWDSGGVPLTQDSWYPDNFSGVSDGRGGAIFAWSQGNWWTFMIELRVQRVDSAGIARWGPQGVVADSNRYVMYDYYPRVVTDGENGAIIVWAVPLYYSWLDTLITQLWAQRVDSTGSLRWGEGVLIDSPDVEEYFPEAASDGQGGVIVSWPDYWSTNGDNYAARIDGEGNILWSFPLCTAEGWQSAGSTVSNGEGGVLLPGQTVGIPASTPRA